MIVILREFCKLFVLFYLFSISFVIAILSMEPKIVYMDGQNRWDSCLTGLKRSVHAESGILYSHTAYGIQPYNASKNCFLTITVPLEYRIRFKILDFNVFGNWRHCEKDTLHIFDHEQSIDPEHIENIPTKERTPGSIIGQFCGKYSEITEKDSKSLAPNIFLKHIAESTHNSLTLWWHTDANNSIRGGIQREEGFRLLWSSFRTLKKKERCKKESEFTCSSGSECIPVGLGCNSYSDCSDESDLDRHLQIFHHCEHIPGDIFSHLTGVKKLLICIVVVLVFGAVCFLFCFIFFHICWAKKSNYESEKRNQNSKPFLGTVSNIISDANVNCKDKFLKNNGKINPPPPNFLPPQAPISSKENINNSHQFQVDRVDLLNIHHHKQKSSKSYPIENINLPLTESSSTSSSSHNKPTVSSLKSSTTTHQQNSNCAAVLPLSYSTRKAEDGGPLIRTTNMLKSPRITSTSPFSQQKTLQLQNEQKKTLQFQNDQKKNLIFLNNSSLKTGNEADYTYVQNEQKHLLL